MHSSHFHNKLTLVGPYKAFEVTCFSSDGQFSALPLQKSAEEINLCWSEQYCTLLPAMLRAMLWVDNKALKSNFTQQYL